MQNIKVYIDGKQVDLPTSDFILNMTFALKDKNGIAINTGSRSEYSFEFPATNNNNQIFSRFWDVAEYTSNKQIFLDAYIEVNGMAFFQGKCQLTSTKLRPDLYYWQGQTYLVAFYGNNVDWTVQVGNKFLYQYDYGTHVYDESNIFLGLGRIYPLSNYKYILIKWKDWAVPGQVDIFEFTPAIFIKTIVDRIFADINYSVQSNFFNSEFFKRLVMPIPLQDTIYDPQYGIDYLNVAANDTITDPDGNYYPFILTNQTVTPPLATPNPYDTTTGIYTVPATGYYYSVYTIEIIEPVNQYGLTTYISQNGGFYPANFLSGSYFNLAFGFNGNKNIRIESNVEFLNIGETLSFFMTAATIGTTAVFNISMEIYGEAQVTSGVTLDFRYFINQTWNSLDFIRGLAHAFNLTFQTDVNNRIVHIEPSDTYLYQVDNTNNLQTGFYNGQTYDKTQSVDLDKEGEIFSVSEIQSQFCLSWQYDSNDPTLEAINAGAGLDLMQAQFVFPTNRFQSGQEVIENPFFSATLCIADNTITTATTNLIPIIPLIWSVNYLEQPTSAQANYDIMPRILYSYINYLNLNGEINVNFSTGVSPVYVPPAYMVNYNSVDGNFISLSFGNETVNGFNIKGLLERFYLLEFIRQQSGKQVECYIFWNVVEIFNLDFRKYVKIHGDNYILQEVNSFNVALNRSTKTYLLNNYLGDGTEASQIENTLLNSRLNA